MNKIHLQKVFSNYIEKFEKINEPGGENYKWEIAEKFQHINIEDEDFTKQMLNAAKKMTETIHKMPFGAMDRYYNKYEEKETVREMFRKLFADKDCDFKEKQKKIDEFIEKSEELRQKYETGSRIYEIGQGEVMRMLFLKHPENNYGYKAAPAKEFADCIEFYEDWGPLTNFNLEKYYRMCDQILEEIKNNKALVETHKSRYECPNEFYADENLHILLYDIIFCAYYIGLYSGTTYDTINAKARNAHFEMVKKAKEKEEAFEKAQAVVNSFEEGKKYLADNFKEGKSIHHKNCGDGIIKSVNFKGKTFVAEFPQKSKTLNLVISKENLTKFITFASPEILENIIKYLPYMDDKKDFYEKLAEAEKDLQPYLEYLE